MTDVTTRGLIDLHTHSTASDGTLTPSELIDAAEAHRLAVVALTDHDTVGGLSEAARRAELYPKLHFLPGIEISAIFQTGTLHILGLGINPAKSLLEMIRQLREAREERNPKIIAKLQAMDVAIDMEDVLAVVPGSHELDARIVSRVHIADALFRKGYVRNFSEAFDKYIGQSAPAYVDKEKLSPREAFDAIHSAGGAAVLAHPLQLMCENSDQLERILRQFILAGLDGLECYHSDHQPELTRQYLDLARKLNLLITGGSDFHGSAKTAVKLGIPPTPLSVIREDYARKWNLDNMNN